MDTTQATAQAVEEARIEAGIDRKALSVASGIPYATLHRSLEGHRDLKVSEVERLARALNRDPNSLIRFPEVA